MIYRGTIVGLFGKKGSGLAMLGIEDDLKGRVLIPCDGNPTCRMLNVVFPGTLRDGTFYNDAIVGERIYYELDSLGVLLAFAPLDRAPLEKIAEYEKQSSQSKKGTHTRGGFLPEDHWLYSSGPIVSGRPIVPPPKDPPSGAERVIDHGLLPPDDPIYSVGPIVNGREIGKPYRKMTPEEIERNFQVARDAIAKGNKKPSENN